MPAQVRLYSFFNSSASYRVRIALALEGLSYEICPVNIRNGAHKNTDFLGAISPSAGVPVLAMDGLRISQSLAIIDYLDQRFPAPSLIPLDPVARASVLSFANLIACDIHPLNNLRVLRYLQEQAGVSAEGKDVWYNHWIAEGFDAVERMLVEANAGPYCFGATPSLADCCLVPQIANALRMKCSLDLYPTAMEVYRHAAAQAAFQSAAAERQPDYLA